MSLIKVKENINLSRDTVTNAILSTNNNELERYKKNKIKNREYEEAIKDINNIKSELNEIKSLLTQLVGK